MGVIFGGRGEPSRTLVRRAGRQIGTPEPEPAEPQQRRPLITQGPRSERPRKIEPPKSWLRQARDDREWTRQPGPPLSRGWKLTPTEPETQREAAIAEAGRRAAEEFDRERAEATEQ